MSAKSCAIQQYQAPLRRSTLEERAMPNQRLVRVFGIDNAFTTTNTNYYRSFVTKVRLELRTSNDDWRYLAGITFESIGHRLSDVEDRQASFVLVDFVQIVVFRAVMFKFFSSVPMPSDEDIKSITSKINTLWIASKNQEEPLGASMEKEKEGLLLQLRDLFHIPQDQRIEGPHNPLNILLPAYETLWRIVLRLLIEVRFRNTEEEYSHNNLLFEAFLSNPSPRTFDKEEFLSFSVKNIVNPNPRILDKKGRTRISVHHIVNEGLRLYPPTRRIYRQMSDEKVSVDVENLQRNPEFWGLDASEFQPGRFDGMKLCKMPFLPFGAGVFECPAKNTFGPMMIGILVSALTLRIGKQYRLSGEGVEDVTRNKVPLENGRKAYEDLLVELVR
ncbi:hypothetical protein EG329_005726 [Mollisiaceae sp. DMI_Dod_QoI]|nr:hypothetical protein EG329_005726 [Helotiales sp. DMI_Dod_QoI]